MLAPKKGIVTAGLHPCSCRWHHRGSRGRQSRIHRPVPLPSTPRRHKERLIDLREIDKGSDGIGLDIGKVASGGCVRRLKICLKGDLTRSSTYRLLSQGHIVGVNGQELLEFSAIVSVIKSLPPMQSATSYRKSKENV